MTYALYAHTGDWRAGNTMRQGYELNYPLIAVETEAHAGALPAKHAFARIEPGNVILTVMKKAEDDGALDLPLLRIRRQARAGEAGSAARRPRAPRKPI